MNRREFVSGLTAAAAFAGVTPTAAAAEGRRVALVIGNGAYGNVPALLNPPNDASDIAAALKRLGFTVSLATNASFDEMRQGLIEANMHRDVLGMTRRQPQPLILVPTFSGTQQYERPSQARQLVGNLAEKVETLLIDHPRDDAHNRPRQRLLGYRELIPLQQSPPGRLLSREV